MAVGCDLEATLVATQQLGTTPSDDCSWQPQAPHLVLLSAGAPRDLVHRSQAHASGATGTRRSASTSLPDGAVDTAFGPDAQHLGPLEPTLLDGIAVDPILGLDAQHLDPIVPTLPDGAAVDPALGPDVQLPTFSPTYSSWPRSSLTRSKFTLDMLSAKEENTEERTQAKLWAGDAALYALDALSEALAPGL
ncbi:hypothetical protein M885DRAFT_578068 [Pelagophyceae sp. CCMP2097]|nr:hypothetical protein M885DRAFT_578068 [Pelagophyceae sp. CCMP2097]